MCRRMFVLAPKSQAHSSDIDEIESANSAPRRAAADQVPSSARRGAGKSALAGRSLTQTITQSSTGFAGTQRPGLIKRRVTPGRFRHVE